MKNIFKFIFLTLCLFSQVQASDTETLNSLKNYLSDRKQQIASKINFYCIRHKYIYKPEEKYWLYQGKSEAFDEIETYLYLYEKHNSSNENDTKLPQDLSIPEQDNSKFIYTEDGRNFLIFNGHMYLLKFMIPIHEYENDLPA